MTGVGWWRKLDKRQDQMAASNPQILEPVVEQQLLVVARWLHRVEQHVTVWQVVE